RAATGARAGPGPAAPNGRSRPDYPPRAADCRVRPRRRPETVSAGARTRGLRARARGGGSAVRADPDFELLPALVDDRDVAQQLSISRDGVHLGDLSVSGLALDTGLDARVQLVPGNLLLNRDHDALGIDEHAASVPVNDEVHLVNDRSVLVALPDPRHLAL